MGLLKYSAIGITKISGKIGGTVFAFNRYGNYARNYAKPTNPKTDLQTQNRNRFGAIASSFRTLTTAQFQAWKEWGNRHPVINAIGDSVPLSPLGAFMSVNQNRIQTGLGGLVKVPEQDIEMPGMAFDQVTFMDDGDATIDLVFTESVDASTFAVGLSMYMVPVGQNLDFGSVFNLYGFTIHKEVPAGTAVSIDENDLNPEFVNLFTGADPGQVIYLRAKLYAKSGQATPEITTRTLLVHTE